MSGSISCSAAAQELLRQCVAGEAWNPDLALQLAAPECSDALFRIVFEGLADRFEPRLCDDYACIFSLILQQPELVARYRRVREPRVCTLDPDRVVVLSRVTLGADIAITSVILDAARQRFPNARLAFAGSAKAAELFAEFSGLEHVDVPYARQGTIAERITSARYLRERFDSEGTIIIDPDSRLTQLGLLPITDDDRYFFFESRAYGGDGHENLTTLTRKWVAETFACDPKYPLPGSLGSVKRALNQALVLDRAPTAGNPPGGAPIAPCNGIYPPPEDTQHDGRYAAISLGTADNSAKQLSPDFERALIQLLCERFENVIVDRGFGPEEFARVEYAIAGTKAKTWSGSFASFTSVIRGSACYVGYDSAGQHAAASFGTPLVTLFKGFVNDRMFERWQPSGPGPKRVLKIMESISLREVAAALDSFSSSSAPESA